MIVKKRCETVDTVGIVCDRMQPRYGYKLTDDGNEYIFTVVGGEDTYAEILRHKDDTDYSILKRYLFDNPQKDVGIYGERADLLTDVNDMKEMVDSLQSLYSSLPNEIKAKYKNFTEVINGFTQEDLQILENNLNNFQDSVEVARDE